ncbi:MAG: 3-isopropylmalate dehydratase, partial [Phycisphaerae bacterium]|nr:3-isopropylmalate dehydratase [Phycisphaerae bacterium]
SREHAPLAIAEAACHVVVAESYARIFYRNSINGGYLVPISFDPEALNGETPQRPIEQIATGDDVEVDIAAGFIKNHSSGRRYALKPLGDVAAIIEAGGIFEYARRSGMLK